MIISNESMNFNGPKESNDPQLFDDPQVFDGPQVFDDPQLFDDQLGVWTPSLMVLFSWALLLYSPPQI